MKRSRYVVKSSSYDGRSNIFYNLRTGLGLKVEKELADSFDELAQVESLQGSLGKYGFLQTAEETDEVAEAYRKRRAKMPFHLVIMPHQNCNFRCVYCYEKFDKNAMHEDVEAGLVKLVERELRENRHEVFTVSWFGGEPLLAVDVIERLSIKFIELCEQYGTKYFASATTNGYLLNEDVLDVLLRNRVFSYQITIDGVKDVHDRQRVTYGGQPTYDRIVQNLMRLSKRTERFYTMVRMNVGPENYRYVEKHIRDMKERLGQDERFALYFHNIGHWGGENDEQVEVCEENINVQLINKTLDEGMKAVSVSGWLRPNTACYAASPHSYVVGVDGLLYKCTVALYDERNHVGRLLPDGTLELKQDLIELWTESGLKDEGCRQCFFAPACNGDSCPMVRIQQGTRPCPTNKKQVKEIVTLMDRQGYPFAEIKAPSIC